MPDDQIDHQGTKTPRRRQPASPSMRGATPWRGCGAPWCLRVLVVAPWNRWRIQTTKAPRHQGGVTQPHHPCVPRHPGEDVGRLGAFVSWWSLHRTGGGYKPPRHQGTKAASPSLTIHAFRDTLATVWGALVSSCLGGRSMEPVADTNHQGTKTPRRRQPASPSMRSATPRRGCGAPWCLRVLVVAPSKRWPCAFPTGPCGRSPVG